MVDLKRLSVCFATLLCALLASLVSAQSEGARPPSVVSPEVAEANDRVSFRLLAPKAQAVRLIASDIPGVGRGVDMAKGSDGVWEHELDVRPGYYRYAFDVDGVFALDPRNPATSESSGNSWSLVSVPGESWMDIRSVPRGAVAEVTYESSALGHFRRMHVYTPPGYEKGEGRYPVFYLLHGAYDSDDSWSTVGRAGFILDNLIADGRAKPMIVVMTAGHTVPFRFGDRLTRNGDFERDFVGDVVPYVESHYRVLTDRANRALAGLSMGGAQTLNIGIPDLGRFGYLGVFSSGVMGIVPRPNLPAPDGPSFEERHREVLDDVGLKEGLELFWFATGEDDFLLETTKATIEMFRRHGFDVTYRETEGGHTWINWREYLREFVTQLFR